MNPKLCMRRKTWVAIRPFSSTSDSLVTASVVKAENKFEVLTFGNVPVTYKISHTLQTRQLTHAILLDITCSAIQTRTVAAYVYSCGVHHLPRSSLETTDFHTSLSSSICQDSMAQESCTEGFHFVRHFIMVDVKCLRTTTSRQHQGKRKAWSLKGMYKALRGFNRHTLLTH